MTTAPNCNAAADLVAALKLAKTHLDHMAAWISRDNRGYSFEALGEDMPAINDALRIDVPQLTAELTESNIQATIDASPQALQNLGNMLCDLLDEDQWKKAEALLLAVAHRGVETQARDRVEAFLDRVTRYSGGIDLHGAFLSFGDLREILPPAPPLAVSPSEIEALQDAGYSARPPYGFVKCWVLQKGHTGLGFFMSAQDCWRRAVAHRDNTAQP